MNPFVYIGGLLGLDLAVYLTFVIPALLKGLS